jgi:hypothetical protein
MLTILEAQRKPSASTQTTIARIRAEPDKEKRRAIKTTLPAIVWGAQITTKTATVEGRELSRSGLICLDLDGVADIPGTRAKLQADPHMMAVWLSPSGDGLKALVPIAGTWEAHWQSLESYLMKVHGLEVDGARKDVYGLCFVSHDPDLWMASDPSLVEPFREVESPGVPGLSSNATKRGAIYLSEGSVLSDFARCDLALAPLSTISPDLPYTEWIRIGQAIHCQFGGSGEGLALWDTWSSGGTKYEGGPSIEKHYKSFRSSGVTFKTVLKMAMDNGWKRPKPEPVREYHKQVVQVKTPIREHFSDIIAGRIVSVPMPWPLVDRCTQALSPGTITLLVGTPGATKSWLVLQSILMWHREGIPFAALELEQDYTFWIKRLLALMSRHGGMARLAWVAENPREALEYLEQHEADAVRIMESFNIAGGFTVDQTLAWIKDQGLAGKKVVTIDPVTMLDTSGGKEHEEAKRLMDGASKIAQKFGMSILVVTHNSSLAGLKGNPTLDQVAGGKGYTRFADSVFWLSPTPKEDDNKVMIRKSGSVYLSEANRHLLILKARSGNGVGETICLNFDEISTITSEVGFLSYDKEPSEPRGPTAHDSRSARLQSTPDESEDTF